MRMRRKPWARPELEACAFNVKDPCSNRGKWHDRFVRKQPLHIELGCGKGTFISSLAPKNRDINYLAIDIKSEMLGLTKRNIEKTYGEAGAEIDNVLIMSQDIERITDMMDENDVVDRIYINFCNPWPKPKSKKKRLTHSRQLEKYKVFLKKGGEVRFKTDDDELFDESISYFEECGFVIEDKTYDLHNSAWNEGNIRTEHEEMFSKEGIKIKYLRAVYKG